MNILEFNILNKGGGCIHIYFLTCINANYLLILSKHYSFYKCQKIVKMFGIFSHSRSIDGNIGLFVSLPLLS